MNEGLTALGEGSTSLCCILLPPTGVQWVTACSTGSAVTCAVMNALFLAIRCNLLAGSGLSKEWKRYLTVLITSPWLHLLVSFNSISAGALPDL